MDFRRYSRQTMLEEIGESGQRKLSDASVLIVGLGGLGAPVATYLTGAGIGRIGLADPDVVSLSNLQRQVLYSEEEIGLRKTDCAMRRLSMQSPHTVFDKWDEGLTPDNATCVIGGYDIVVDCTDSYEVRYLIDDVCAAEGKVWIHGSIGEFCGEVALMNGRKGLRYSDLFPEREELCARPRLVAGVIGPLAGIIGAIEAAEVLKWICGFGESLDGRLLTFDIRSLQTDIFEF